MLGLEGDVKSIVKTYRWNKWKLRLSILLLSYMHRLYANKAFEVDIVGTIRTWCLPALSNNGTFSFSRVTAKKCVKIYD